MTNSPFTQPSADEKIALLRGDIDNLNEDSSPDDIANVIEAIPGCSFDIIAQERLLQDIKKKTGTSIGVLRKQLSAIIRNVIEKQHSEPKKTAAGRDLPVVKIDGGGLPKNVDRVESLLLKYDSNIYQRCDMVVRVASELITISDQRQVPGMRPVQIKPMHMIERLTRIIDFQVLDKRSNKWRSIDCPFPLAKAYLERIGEWKLPLLTGIIDTPTLRPDGSIFDKPGYDTKTGLLYVSSGLQSKIPSTPTKEDARAALDFLCDLISGFPFTDESGNDATGKPSPSRSVALSGILTPMIRRSIPHAPMHTYTAPVMGSGKSMLVDIPSMIATGHEAPVLSQGKSEEEMEKRLGSALIAGDVLISFDNCEEPLGGELLCQALTQSQLKIRILGRSQLVSLPTNPMFCATGNNLVVIGDMTRRTIMATLDPKVERPEQREFAVNPIEVIRGNRAEYVVAALTVLRAYIVAGSPAQQGMKPLGSFEAWSRMVRDALVWLGEPDPCLTQERARAEDPKTQQLGAVLCQWAEVIGADNWVTTKTVIEQATLQSVGFPAEFINDDFRESLLVIAGDRGSVNSRRLGKWISRNKGRIINGLRIEQDSEQARGGVEKWKLVRGQEAVLG